MEDDDSQDVKKTDNPLVIFLVGLTAGYIATILPRLLSYLSVSEDSINLDFFTGDYFYASSLFALVIGISMVWLNYGSKETTKNLFMTALALPSVISGAINMTSTTVSGEESLKEMESHYSSVENALQEVMGISDIPVVNLDLKSFEEVGDASFFIPFVNDAYAVENIPAEETQSLSMGVKFRIDNLEKNYIVIVDQSNDLELMKSRFEAYSTVLLIPDLKLKKSGNRYYIFQDVPRTKSFALIEILRLSKNYGIKASLAKIN